MRNWTRIIAWAAAAVVVVAACSQEEDFGVSLWEIFRGPMVGGMSLQGIAGSGPRDVWAVGWSPTTGGTLIHYDGRDWSRYQTPVTGRELNAVAMVSGNLGWAVGGGGVVLKYRDGQWALDDNLSGRDLYGVDFGDDGAGFVVGAAGTIYRYDGAAWTDVSPAGVTADLRAVALSGDGGAWAVGDAGTILRYDGASWKAASSPTHERLNAVTVAAAGAYAAGDNGVVLFNGGAGWVKMANNNTRELYGLAVAGDVAFAAGNGGTLLGLKGNEWGPVSLDWGPHEPDNLNAVYLANSTEGWAVGDQGIMLWYRRPPD